MASGAGKHPETEFLRSYCGLKDCIGYPLDWRRFVAAIASYSGEGLFRRCSQYAANLANSSDGVLNATVQRSARQAASRLRFHPEPDGHRIGLHAERLGDDFSVFHEQGLLFLQAMALLHGRREGGDFPDDDKLLALALAANDFLPVLDHGQAADPAAGLAASFIQIARFNRKGDTRNDIFRPFALFRRPPPRGPFWETERWSQLQQQAFGMTAVDYIRKFAGPLYAFSLHWDFDPSHPDANYPAISVEGLFSKTTLDPRVTRAFLWSIGQTAQTATEDLVAKARNGRPTDLTCLLKKPFVSFAQDQMVAVSPWAVREQIRLGLLSRLMKAAVALDPKRGQQDWGAAFGDMFEGWCREVVQNAGPLPPGYRVLLSNTEQCPGEIEDVVLLSAQAAILFSVKAMILPEKVARTSRHPSDALQWLEDRFFAPTRGKNYRGGAIRQLDGRIAMIRRGDFQNLPPSDIPILPCLVTFDAIPDQLPLNRWMNSLCDRYGLLRQPGVTPITFMDTEDFEIAMAALAAGVDLASVMKLRDKAEYRDMRWEILLREATHHDGFPRPA
ncbi:MAG: hypothetical protein FJ087_14465, partial [Deltaproteobacteria bacterium]|nr:hypothetical protein [Deltaproteobacteria bacterium]